MRDTLRLLSHTCLQYLWSDSGPTRAQSLTMMGVQELLRLLLQSDGTCVGQNADSALTYR